MPLEGTAQVVRGLARFEDPNLLVGAEGFSDAGVYRLRADLCIVQSLDFFPPLVDDAFAFGQIAAANSLSDVYAMGAQPTTALNIVGFPDDKLELDVLTEILRGGADRVRQADAVVAGGHTVRDAEIKYGLSVTGVVHPDRLITNQGARPGDALVLTKALGTGFVTTAHRANQCSASVLEAAIDSMSALNRAASEAAVEFEARAATDITGFGLAGHAIELAESSNVSLMVRLSQLPLLPGAEECLRRGHLTRANATNRSYTEPMLQLDDAVDATRIEVLFDPQTSGGLLISVAADRAEELVERIRASGASSACVIGSVTEQQSARLIVGG